MIGIDTTFLVQLEVQEAPAHQAAHQCLRREVLDPATPIALAATLWQAGVRRLLTSNRSDFQIFGFELLVP